MATSRDKRWPPVGNFVATSGEKPMAIDTVSRGVEYAGRSGLEARRPPIARMGAPPRTLADAPIPREATVDRGDRQRGLFIDVRVQARSSLLTSASALRVRPA
jgi:hypothetical protein